jgi:hypothetical protein
MKNTIIYILLSIFTIMFGCAQKKENREEFKNEHDKDRLRNHLGKSAVPNSEQTTMNNDSTCFKKDRGVSNQL